MIVRWDRIAGLCIALLLGTFIGLWVENVFIASGLILILSIVAVAVLWEMEG